MIKVSQLRIGNYLYDNKDNLCRVEQLNSNADETEVYAPVIKGALTYLPNKPIPLTEETLLKCGFEKVVVKGDFDAGFDDDITYGLEYKREFYLSYDASDFSIAIFSSKLAYDYEDGICIPLESAKYLHQLQNIFFSLTGEELKIEL
jgi:hypothetical protein